MSVKEKDGPAFPLRGHPSHLGALPIVPRTRALDGSTHQPSQAALHAPNSLSGTAFRLGEPLPAVVGTKCPRWQLHCTPEQVASRHGVSQSKEIACVDGTSPWRARLDSQKWHRVTQAGPAVMGAAGSSSYQLCCCAITAHLSGSGLLVL